MNKNFNYEPATAPEPIVFEQIWAEKPGGGILVNCEKDAKKGDLLYCEEYRDSRSNAIVNKYKPLKVQVIKVTSQGTIGGASAPKGIQSITTVEDERTDIGKIGLKFYYNGVTYEITSQKSASDFGPSVYTPPTRWITTPTFDLGANNKTVTAAIIEPEEKTPAYVLGTNVPANSGEQEVRLINGANIRKESVTYNEEMAKYVGCNLV